MGAFFTNSEQTTSFNLQTEINTNIFNILEIVGIHFTFKHKWLQMDLEYAKVLAYAIGWSAAELIKHFLVIIVDARSIFFVQCFLLNCFRRSIWVGLFNSLFFVKYGFLHHNWLYCFYLRIHKKPMEEEVRQEVAIHIIVVPFAQNCSLANYSCVILFFTMLYEF